VDDIIVTSDGRHVGRLDAAFLFSPGIRLGQIVQDTVDEIQVNIVKADYYNQNDEHNLERALRARIGDVIGIKFNFVNAIPQDKNGKHKFVVSKPARKSLQQMN
jgi:phenylacetate-CoA ligase